MQIESFIEFLEDEKFKLSFNSTKVNFYVDKSTDTHQAEGPNPLELFCSALGSCVGIFAKRYFLTRKIPFTKINIKVSAVFNQSSLLLENIKLNLKTDAKIDDKKDDFLRYIKNCPIHNTILGTKQITFNVE